MPIVSTPGQIPQSNTALPTDDASISQAPATSPADNVPINPVTAPITPQDQSVSGPSRMQTMVDDPATVTATQTADSADSFPSDDDDFFGDDTFDSAPPAVASKEPKKLSLSRMNEDVRKSVINKTFDLVLGRVPADRDYSYYRFSTLTEDSLMNSLLGLPEHKQMIEKAKEHTKLKQESQSLDLRVSEADQRLASMQEEVVTLRQLLDEKNQYIRQLRGMPVDENPSTAQATTVSQFAQQETTQNHYTPLPHDDKNQGSVNSRNITSLPTPWDEVKSLFATILNRRK